MTLISSSSNSASYASRQVAQANENISKNAALEKGEAKIERHVAAHNAVGSQYSSAPTYSYGTADDGTRYIVSGDVSFDTSTVANNPEQTLSKAQLIQRAALAPSDPTPSDIAASQRAQQLANDTRLEMQRLDEENLGTSIDTYV